MDFFKSAKAKVPSPTEKPNVPNIQTDLQKPKKEFHSLHYLRHNQRRLEHLVSLNLPIHGASVLEVGAGIGDHTHFFLDRNCKVTSTEGRSENLALLKSHYPQIECLRLDMDAPQIQFSSSFEIVYCYGLLYHLKQPVEALAYLAACCSNLLLLETCVSFGNEELINSCSEPAEVPSQAVSGQGCRPTRPWVFNELKKHFEFVYITSTQPNHEEFPLDWTVSPQPGRLTRSVFVASRQKINNPLLLEEIPLQQRRH